MKYLAINTAGPIIEILIVYEDKVCYRKLKKVQAATQLLPEVDGMLFEMDLNLNDLDRFVCVVGPGSFTGIRIGIVAVRTMAYALKKEVYGVTYSRLMAYNTPDKCITLIDGGNGGCFKACYEGDKTICEPECIYKKDVKSNGEKIISDYKTDFSELYVPNADSFMKAAEYAINNKSVAKALYIRKPQPERKENDI